MTIDYIQSTNQVGYNVELWTKGLGWYATGIPHATRELALAAMADQQAAAPAGEFRVYPALAGKSNGARAGEGDANAA